MRGVRPRRRSGLRRSRRVCNKRLSTRKGEREREVIVVFIYLFKGITYDLFRRLDNETKTRGEEEWQGEEDVLRLIVEMKCVGRRRIF